MPETASVAADLSTLDYLLSFLKAILDGRYRLGGALSALVPTVGGCAGDPERLQELSRSGGLRLAAGFCEAVAAP